jgi:hypothetical protein
MAEQAELSDQEYEEEEYAESSDGEYDEDEGRRGGEVGPTTYDPYYGPVIRTAPRCSFPQAVRFEPRKVSVACSEAAVYGACQLVAARARFEATAAADLRRTLIHRTHRGDGARRAALCARVQLLQQKKTTHINTHAALSHSLRFN